jgi:hypothetical protein
MSNNLIKYLITALILNSSLVFSKDKATSRDNFSYGSLFKELSGIPDPFSLRDPFKKPLIIKSGAEAKGKKQGVIKDGVYTNLFSFDDVPLDKIKITGIIVGKNRRALANIDGKIVILKEGMKLGLDKIELKAILPGGIVLVEKLKNVYGQDEYIETVIPISD